MNERNPERCPTLFSPGAIGRTALPNRAAVAPMTRVSANPDGTATARMAEYYARYARGGFGLVITEGTYIDRRYSQGYLGQPGIADEAQRDSWSAVVEAVHAENVPVFMQLLHPGALVQHNDHVDGAIAPSAVQPRGEMAPHYMGRGRFPVPREITTGEIQDVMEAFADAAVRAAEAGFDGIELHGANGYLPDQFLTEHTNLRADGYGGPIERRVRFHVELVTAVRDALAGRIPFGIRISESKVNDLAYSWPGGADDAEAIFGAIGRAGPTYIHVNAHRGFEPVFGTGKSLAALAREAAPDSVQIVACGKLHDAAQSERMLAAGTADAVAIAKGALADPDWPRKVRGGDAPVAFDPDMIRPAATLENTKRWRRERAAAGG